MTINNPMNATYTTRYKTRARVNNNKTPKIHYMDTPTAIRHYVKYRVLPFIKYSILFLTVYYTLVFFTIAFSA